jgi:hypothetical protein
MPRRQTVDELLDRLVTPSITVIDSLRTGHPSLPLPHRTTQLLHTLPQLSLDRAQTFHSHRNTSLADLNRTRPKRYAELGMGGDGGGS